MCIEYAVEIYENECFKEQLEVFNSFIEALLYGYFCKITKKELEEVHITEILYVKEEEISFLTYKI